MAVIAVALQMEELESLRQLAFRPLEHLVPVKHVEKLINCGFAAMRAGGPMVTTGGHAKLALEITRSNWLGEPA